ncbi:transcriptional repressor NrdR [Candidatus Micrarchaeota archaeon]|nr:transcriptional repressor NrdR [Candidatus Micrarchaeota archaeon]
MRCPYCNHPETRVIDSRDTDSGVRRRRECLKCGRRFTTYETIQLNDLYVIKKDNRRELFDREKLRRGITRACEKRPISSDTIERIVSDIEAKLRASMVTEVKSSRIGQMVMSRLMRLDPVAYIRFASVYKEFDDIDAFEKALQTLKKRKSKKRKRR